MLGAESHELVRNTKAPRRLLSALFLMLGAAAFILLAVWVGTTEAILESERTLSALLWNTANSVGVLRPALIIFVGVMLIRLGRHLATGDIAAVRWAVLISNWLVFAALVLMVFMPLRASWQEGSTAGDVYIALAPYVVLFIALLILRQFVVANRVNFHGDEDITSKQTRHAWNLLAPTLIVMMLIAISPLEQVFITSLTDERFASDDEITFVGLENYNRLWSVRLDTVPCETDDSGACLVEDGEIVYPRLRRYFPEDSDYVELRYRDFAEFDLFGQHWVLSARDIEFVESVITSVYYTFMAIFFQFTLGFFMAMIIAQRVRGIGIMRVVMLVPMAIPTLIATQFWEVMLRPDTTGLINVMLLNMGIIQEPQQWLLNPALQVPTLVAVIVWKETPITALLLLPGLLAIPREVYQAAAIDGANRVQRFWQITLPMMRPTLGVTLVLRTMVFLRVFDLFEILVGRTRYVMATYAHDALIQRQQLGYSSAISVTIFIVTMLFTISYMRTLRIDEA